MTTIAVQLPRTIASRIFDDAETLRMPQGVDGRHICAAALEAEVHWSARPSIALEIARREDPFTYDSVPLTFAGKVRVIFRDAGRLQPRPYRLD